MSIVREEDFEGEYPKWFIDPTISEEDKKKAIEIAGKPESWSWTHSANFDDDCFFCGKKLSIPFVYWHGNSKGVCLHPKCAALFGGAMMRDYFETQNGKDEADQWWHYEMKTQIEN